MPDSLAAINVGVTGFPMRSEPRCRTCAHDRRAEIELEVARGRGYRPIVRGLGVEDEVSAENLRDHVRNGHMPVVAPAVQAVARQRAEEVLEAAQPMAASLAGHILFAQSVVDRVRERLEAGEVELSIRDGVAAAKLLATAAEGAGGSDAAEMEAYLVETVGAVHAIMTGEQLDQFNSRMQAWIRTRPKAI